MSKLIKKWTEKEKKFIEDNINGMSNNMLAQELDRTSKMIGSYLWKNGITRDKSIKRSLQKKVEKVVEKETKIKTLKVSSLVSNPKAEDFQDRLNLFFSRIRKSVENESSVPCAGQKVIYIEGRFFKRQNTSEYLYYIEKEEKSYFLKTGIYNGNSLIEKGKSTKEKLNNFRLAYLTGMMK